MSRLAAHRGSHYDGYINAKYFHELITNMKWYEVLTIGSIFSYEDAEAIDWIGRDSRADKLISLIFKR